MNLAYPLKEKGVTTSKYGNRMHPVKKKEIHHNGIDIGVKQGTSVKAIEDGEVVRSDMADKNGYGNFICIKHNNLGGSTKFSCYAHLSERLKSVGDKVVKGEEIGKSGGRKWSIGSGSSTGPHLHFEIRRSLTGDWEDPQQYLNAGSTEILPDKKSKDNIFDFLKGTSLKDFFAKFAKEYESLSKEKQAMTENSEAKKPKRKVESKKFFKTNPIKIISDPRGHSVRSTKDWSSSNAYDIKAPVGTEIYSLTAGKVLKKHESSNKKGNIFGTQLSIQGIDGFPDIFYTHIEGVTLNPGDMVLPGDYIGKITEWSAHPNSSHVHIGIERGHDVFDFMDKSGNIKKIEDEYEVLPDKTPEKDPKKFLTNLKDIFAKYAKEYESLSKEKQAMWEEVDRMKDIMKKIL
jgi:murein DD-endopeptidase MepM/ murein hydrolase activator NlpD